MVPLDNTYAAALRCNTHTGWGGFSVASHMDSTNSTNLGVTSWIGDTNNLAKKKDWVHLLKCGCDALWFELYPGHPASRQKNYCNICQLDVLNTAQTQGGKAPCKKAHHTGTVVHDDWSVERPSNGFQLGEVMHIRADVSTGNHLALRLFVDSCVATLGPDRDSSPLYAVIDFNGCLLDGRSDDTISAFISPRPRQDTLKFMVDAFRFAGDTSNLIYITCHLKVTSADQAPDPLNKACSFNKAGNVWSPVEGTRNICSFCETGNCGQLAQTRRVNPLDSWPGRCFQREMPSRNGAAEGPSMMVGLVVVTAALAVASVALGFCLV
ncbi:C2 domain-containing protein 2-like [Platysternon megacephalum]|uniref:Zona pellucida sperm-binding protein 3 n=1 Tax=Platysternon megacephalum TaxID=55544 RepID=A0A4D9DQ25_9SAUR|nr:C2 domain-containing protein 2-like [Platysternon megacephalum]